MVTITARLNSLVKPAISSISHPAQAGTTRDPPVEHPGIEAHSSTALQTQKQNQNGIKITSEVDWWIQAK